MSLYLFETGPTGDSEVEQALALVSRRFPEIVVERLYTSHSGCGADVWVCRAPNVAHMQRWAEAGRLRLSHLRQVDLADPRTDGPGNDSAATTERKE
jgi:hypothetical protein